MSVDANLTYATPYFTVTPVTTAAPASSAATTPATSAPAAAADSKQADAKAAPVIRGLFPPIEPYKTGRLKVSETHELYYELVGNPNGKPVCFVHGGPGGGIASFYRQFFDPKVWNVLLFDQRGSGQSTPFACLEENTTWDLVADMEKLRQHIGVEKWLLFGGSWGSTLSIAYALKHPDRVKALVLRGIFGCRSDELQFFYQEGSSWLFPDAWEKFLAPIPPVERKHLMSAYHRRLTGKDEKVKVECARAWSIWEMATSRLYVDPEYIARAADDDKFAVAFARIECHYFVNGAFLEKDDQIIDGGKLLEAAKIPGVIVQGRYDLVCPMKSAWELHKNWPSSKLVVIPDAGHSAKEPGIIDQLIKAVESYAHL